MIVVGVDAVFVVVFIVVVVDVVGAVVATVVCLLWTSFPLLLLLC